MWDSTQNVYMNLTHFFCVRGIFTHVPFSYFIKRITNLEVIKVNTPFFNFT